MTRYTCEFSHSYEAGPSGPARSYWNIRGPGDHRMTTVCLLPNSDVQIRSITHMLDVAFKMGRISKAEELRAALHESIGT